MRVALYTETFLPKIDGIVRVVCLTLEHLQRRRIQALVVAPEQGMREYAGAQVIGVPCIRNPVYPEGRIGIPSWQVYRKVKAFAPDLIHSFHPVNIGMMGVVHGHWLHKPVLSSFHLDIAHMAAHYGLPRVGKLLRILVTYGFNQSAYSLAPSRLIQAKMRAEGVKRVGWWRRGVDAEQFHPRFRRDDVRAALSDGHPEDVLLLYVGRLAPEKNLDQLRAVLERVPRTRLALVGGGPQREALAAHFAGLPVHFAGYRTGRSLAEAYASADLFVFPSAFESFGLVILEAMASGLPVISTRVGGAGDMIAEGVTGYTVEVGDVEGMIEGVRQLASDPDRLRAAKQAARAHAERFDWSHIMDELIDCYRAIICGETPRL
jgi:glycosyltransferase involved in cell wall biosynthesis